MADYEIIKPKVDLRKKVRVLPSSPDFDPVAKAEQAMQRLSVNFAGWMKQEVSKLQIAWDKMDKEQGSEEALEAVFRVSHDIRGQAHTMGFPIAGTIAGSLCDLIEKVPDREKLPVSILHKHVQAITAVVNENAREEEHRVGKELASELCGIGAEIIAKHGIDDEEDNPEDMKVKL